MTDAERKIIRRAEEISDRVVGSYYKTYLDIARQTLIWEAERNLSLVQHLICTRADVAKLLKERNDSLQAELESLNNG